MMTPLRSRPVTLVVTVVLGVLVMILVQRSFLVIPLVSALPAAVVAGLFAAGARPHASLLERFRTAAFSAVLTVVVVGLWMGSAIPSGYLPRILLGWAVVVVLLTVVHGAVAAGTSRVMGRRPRRDPTARLR